MIILALTGERNYLTRGVFDMEIYKDLNGDSGVTAFEIGSDFIIVRFSFNSEYLYNYASAGKENIEAMKKLAKTGDGLNSYINKHVKKLYAKKLK